MGQKLCFVCYSPNHLIKDCNHHSRYLNQFPKTKLANHKPKPRENKPVWNHANRVNHSNFSNDYRYPPQRRSFSKPPVPSSNNFQNTGRTVPSQSTVRNSPNQGAANTFASVRPSRWIVVVSPRSYTCKSVGSALIG